MSFVGIGLLVLTVIIFSLIGVLYSRGRKFSLEDYITSRNSLGLRGLIGTLLASSMGAWILFSPSEATVSGGLVALVGYALGSAGALFVFITIGARVRKLMPKGHTLTEYVLHRFGKGMYVFVLVIMLFYMGVFLTAELTGIAKAVEMVFGIPLFFTAVVVGLGTVAYTSVGGLSATLFTDRIQSWFIVPLLGIVFFASVWFVDVSQVLKAASVESPHIFDFSFGFGIEYALTLIIAIIGAELFNQGNWQRVFVPSSMTILKKGFLIAGLIVIPIVVVCGLFGILSIGTGTASDASVSLFAFLLESVPSWILLVGMVLAIILIMSSMDTLLNGMVSLFTVDFARLDSTKKQKRVLFSARVLTFAICVVSILIARRGYSVLYLFLVADLVCVAAAFPTFYGLFSRKLHGWGALLSSGVGIVVGGLIFPTTDFSKSVFRMVAGHFGVVVDSGLLSTGSLLWSFVLAFVSSGIVSVVISAFQRKSFSFDTLKERVGEIV